MSLLKAAAEQVSAHGGDPARLVNLAMPQARDEAWRYFPLRQVLGRRYLPSASASVASASDIGAVIELSATAALPGSVRRLEVPSVVADVAVDGFAGLVEQVSAPVMTVEIVADPVVPLRLRRESGVVAGALQAQRWYLRVAAGVRAVVLDELNGAADTWTGDDLQIELGVGAQLTWLRCVEDAATAVRQSRTRVAIAAGASLQWIGVDASVGISRHELRIELAGEQSSVSVRGGGLLSGKSYSETRLALEHQHPGGDSSTLWKLVGTEQSRGVFNGRIAIAVGADRSDAQLRTASLLLSEQAEIDVKPELEIYADEVSASHGATVGQLDERALFYLRSRGVALEDARRMLTEAFLRELYDGVPEGPARVLVESTLARCLPQLDELAA